MKQKNKSDFSSSFCSFSTNFYDWLKVLAVVTMVIDHIGYYLFPDVLGLRLVGRIAFPIFLFLVGVNGSFRWRWSLFLITLLVQFAMQIWRSSFSLTGRVVGNILLVIVCSRVLLLWISKVCNYSFFILVFPCLIYLLFYTSFWFWFVQDIQRVLDYWVLGFLFAFCGYFFTKSQQIREKILSIFSLIWLLFLLATSNIAVFHFSYFWDLMFLFISYIFLWLVLMIQAYLFQKKKNLTFDFVYPFNQIFYFISHNALFIYAVHIFLLLIVSYFLRKG